MALSGARDAFVVKGNVKAKLYNNEWKYVRSTLKDGSKAVFEVVEEKEISQPEADACGESYCIVLEIHRNGTIADEIKAKNDKIKAGSKRQAAAYTEEEIWKLLIEMTCAVGTMHWIENDKKPLYLLHRDLRTSNILSRDIGCCGIKLCGFGLTAPETEHVEIANPTTDDMKVWPPERARGEKVNNRCDIFMLGAAVYEMMALQPIHEVKDGNIGKFGEELNEGNIEPLDKTMARQYSRELVSVSLDWTQSRVAVAATSDPLPLAAGDVDAPQRGRQAPRGARPHGPHPAVPPRGLRRGREGRKTVGRLPL